MADIDQVIAQLQFCLPTDIYHDDDGIEDMDFDQYQAVMKRAVAFIQGKVQFYTDPKPLELDTQD